MIETDMPKFRIKQIVRKFDNSNYHYLEIDRETVSAFEKKRATRLICVVDEKISYACGLNHLGNGNFFIIVSKARLKLLNKTAGDAVEFEIFEDPNPLGVEIPKVLQILLADDKEVRAAFDKLTDGKKRSLIYSTKNIKDIDLQVRRILNFISSLYVTIRGC